MPMSELEFAAHSIMAKDVNFKCMTLREKLLQKRLYEKAFAFLKKRNEQHTCICSYT